MEKHVGQALDEAEAELISGKSLAAERDFAVAFVFFDEHFNASAAAVLFFVDYLRKGAFDVSDDASDVDAFVSVINSVNYHAVFAPIDAVVQASPDYSCVPCGHFLLSLHALSGRQ